jgi:hypothetical protein
MISFSRMDLAVYLLNGPGYIFVMKTGQKQGLLGNEFIFIVDVPGKIQALQICYTRLVVYNYL